MNNSESQNSWRLIYTDNTVLDLFESEGVTSTIYNLFVAENKQECLDHISSLNLYYNNENNS